MNKKRKEDQSKRKEEMIKIIKSQENKLDSPWKNYDFNNNKDENYILDVDREVISKENSNLKNRIIWEGASFKKQIPVPINGNFFTAKYLLLYSNPGTEKEEYNHVEMKITDNDKEKLLKCFLLDEDAELIIPNKQWEDWYIGELDKFFNTIITEKPEFNIKDFFNDFCFLNLSAYPTNKNEFNYKSKELEVLMELESTKFIKKLVELGIEAGKEVLIMRRSEGVWKVKDSKGKPEYLFDKLSSYYKK